MAFEDSGELADFIYISLSSLKDIVDTDELEFAADTAIRELSIELPFDGTPSRLEYWCIERGKRHALDIVRINSAYKFKYKQINLQQRFEQIDKMIARIDDLFEKALQTDTALVDVMPSTFDLIGPQAIGGDYIPSGFIYDSFGNDVTKEIYMAMFPNVDIRSIA